jgi:hypothetical protein
MYMPSGLGARLKHQQGLERIARPLHVQVYMFVGAVALRLRDNLQWGGLAVQMAEACQTQSERSRPRGSAQPE